MHINTIAQLAHEANRSYCQLIGDNSQPEWKDAPDWQIKSAINGVVFHYNNRNATPADSHASWLAEKKADGWSYGPIKDPIKKEHPCYCAYEQLPVEQQIKDYVFRSVLHGAFAVEEVQFDDATS